MVPKIFFLGSFVSYVERNCLEGTQRRHNGIRGKFKQVRAPFTSPGTIGCMYVLMRSPPSYCLLIMPLAASLPFLSIIRDTRPSVEATTLLSISSLPKLIDENAQDTNPVFDTIHMSASLDLVEDVLIRSVDASDIGTTSQTSSRPRVEV